jgi:hypothetical protein
MKFTNENMYDHVDEIKCSIFKEGLAWLSGTGNIYNNFLGKYLFVVGWIPTENCSILYYRVKVGQLQDLVVSWLLLCNIDIIAQRLALELFVQYESSDLRAIQFVNQGVVWGLVLS